METIRGYIDHISFQNQENGYTVLALATEAGEITCVGTAKGYTAGESVEVEGNYVMHPVYGQQMKMTRISAAAPTDRAALMRYLCSGAVKGIGEKRAVKIIEHFGDDAYRILEEEPERLTEIKGISPRIVREIAEQLAEKRDERKAVIFMQQYGIGPALCTRLYDRYGDEIYGILKHNPYRLADEVPAVGFKTADEIAKRVGITADSEYRIRSGLQYVLSAATVEGHCYCPRPELLTRTAELLAESGGQDREALVGRIAEELLYLAAEKKIVTDRAGEEERIYLRGFYLSELYCAEHLLELQRGYDPSEIEAGSTEKIRKAAERRRVTLDPSQEQAVSRCLQSGVFILTGGPGTGKTTTINVILECLDSQARSFVLAAPTGRAAKRMSEATGYEAMTIHRLLEIGPSEDGGGFSFGHTTDEPIEADAVIIDEVSMVDLYLMRALLDAIPTGAQLILVGDVDQLPSVGPGQILRDIIDSGAFPTGHLKVVHRQGEESHIVEYAHRINEGKPIDLSVQYNDFFLMEKNHPEVILEYVYQLIRDTFPKYLNVDPMQTQVLTPMRKGPLGVEGLNRLLQERLNPFSEEKEQTEYAETIFRVGDKVMQTKNDYQTEWEIRGKNGIVIDSGKGVFNGDMGRITRIDLFMKTVTVLFDDGRLAEYAFGSLDELDLAYAVTVHKSQGSEYPVVILPLLSGPPRLMTRNLLYTAVTRARRCVVIVGRQDTVQEMIARDYVQKRYTSLRERIREQKGPEEGDGREC